MNNLFDAFIERIAERVVEKLESRAQGDGEYSQDAPPKGMSPKSYLVHCRQGDWPNRKVGRVRFSKRADVDAWLSANTRVSPPLVRAVTEERAKSVDAKSVEEILGEAGATLAKERIGNLPAHARPGREGKRHAT